MSVSPAAPSLSSPPNIRPLKVLHTSDWHLGRRLYGRMRYDEFEEFLSWLYDTIVTQKVDVLIVAGDIFDTMTPSNKAQALYYEFLGKVSNTCCQHVVIVAGNHDSPSFLDAPSQVLKFLNVHVIGTACDDLNDEVLILEDADGNPHCIIAAVPYLRDRDVRNSAAGESGQDKDSNVIAGIRAHYDGVADIAKTHQQALIEAHQRHIPIIATGHLFAAGSKTTDDDGVRDLYVGNLGKVSADMFDECFDYVALGHLHVPQRVGGCEHIRYSGSPIAMGFGEARQQKQVLLIEFGGRPSSNNKNQSLATMSVNSEKIVPTIPKSFENIEVKKAKPSEYTTLDLFADFEEATPVKELDNVTDITPITHDDDISNHKVDNKKAVRQIFYDADKAMQVHTLSIPSFQKLAQISGDLQTIEATIKATIQALTQSRSASKTVWLEVIYTGDDIVSDLREQVQALVENLPCEILKIKNIRTYNKVLNQEQSSETLQDLNEQEVFERCLNTYKISEWQKPILRDAYEQILYNIHYDDSGAE
jgi:exonuclease SbcD